MDWETQYSSGAAAKTTVTKRAVIVAGAGIKNYKWIKDCLNRENRFSGNENLQHKKTKLIENFYIFCDSGLKHARKLGIKPDLIVGDFDSYKKTLGRFNAEVIALPCEKDDTDSFFAAKEAVARGFRDFLIIGAVGQRFDHTVANISMLLYLHNNGCHAELLDDYSKMYFISKETARISDCKYFSTINFDGSAHKITIRNAKYPLNNAEIAPEYQYGISNEVLPGMTAEVEVSEGNLLIIEIYKQ